MTHEAPPWGWYHQGRAAKLLGMRRREIGGLVHRGVLRGVRVPDGSGGKVWALNVHDVDRLAASPNYQHARDIPDVRMLRAIDDAQRVMYGVAMRSDVTRILGGLAPDAPVPSDEVPGVPWRLVLAKFRRVAGRGLADGCDCGCRGDWRLTAEGARLVELSRCTAAPCKVHREHRGRC
ncbi:hypothetical protein FGG44_gp85 [Mycobacterium phage MacnCheese]|uniref:Helix-turn-helix DNA binding domain protein n=1 Tax=Mycobacterium phage MacnCheese TaxID=2927982 RepID=I6WIN8_9CAUD|nr:hypothetical protein FGG44_gp85 [Mycobacterium phage MacnCheese]AFN37773.1 hypothetical protein MACNCHEESE_85 [Mycobacterium phage MacnCheese]